MTIAKNNPFMDDRLIFIISQPRSGSTLLQHILGSHPDVHTLAEPWFMLHLVYALREHGISAEYDARLAYLALRDYLKEIPGGEECYLDVVRHMALYLYHAALDGTGKQFLLDKTPRYYFIISDLYRLFPDARFVFLIRNPLAVLGSLLNWNLRGRWQGLLSEGVRHDIMNAPGLILEGVEKLGERAAVVHYEELVSDPERTVQELCRKLNLDYDPCMAEYGGKVKLKGSFVDSKSIYKHTKPVKDYVSNWPQYLDSPMKVEIAQAYLDLLGKETVESLGYSYIELKNILRHLPHKRHLFRLPWHLLLTGESHLTWWDRVKLYVLSTWDERGFLGMMCSLAGLLMKNIFFRKKEHQ